MKRVRRLERRKGRHSRGRLLTRKTLPGECVLPRRESPVQPLLAQLAQGNIVEAGNDLKGPVGSVELEQLPLCPAGGEVGKPRRRALDRNGAEGFPARGG